MTTATHVGKFLLSQAELAEAAAAEADMNAACKAPDRLILQAKTRYATQMELIARTHGAPSTPDTRYAVDPKGYLWVWREH